MNAKTAKFRYGRVYKAYFFEKPITYPICAVVVAQSFEEALGMVREQFPNRTISSFHPDDDRLVAQWSAVIVSPDLPRTQPPDVPRDHKGIPKELSQGWFTYPKEDGTIETVFAPDDQPIHPAE